MILRSLKLENIRSYIEEKIEFPHGSVLLSGDIGSGKSTILLAIEFALFGIMRSGLSGSSLLRHGTNQGNVELKFSINDDEYLIKRALKRIRGSITQDSGYILTNGRKFEGTPIELKAKILHILGYPEDLLTKSKSLIYRYTVYTAQENMKQILFEDIDDRLNTLRKVFGIDKYKIIKENSVIFIREVKRKQSELKIKFESYDEIIKEKTTKEERQKILDTQLGSLRDEINSIKSKVNFEDTKLNKIQEETKKFTEIKKDIELKNLFISTKKVELDKKEEKINFIKNSIYNLNNKLNDFKDIIDKKNEEDNEKILQKLEEKYSKIIKEKSSVFEKQKYISLKIRTIEEEIKDLTKISNEIIVLKSELNIFIEKLQGKKNQEKLLEEMFNKDKKLKINLGKCNYQITQATELINNVKLKDICPTCNQKVDETHRNKVINEENQKIKLTEIEKKKIDEILKKVTNNIKKIKQNLDILISIEQKYTIKKEHLIKIETQSSKLTYLQKNLSELYIEKKQIDAIQITDDSSLKLELQKLKDELKEIRQNNILYREKKNLLQLIETENKNISSLMSEIKSIEHEILKNKEEIKVLDSSISGFTNIIEEYEKQKKIVEESREKEKQLEIKIASQNQELYSLKENLENLNKKINQLKKIKEQILNTNELNEWFNSFFIKLMTTMEKHIMISIHKEFNSLLKEWFNILIEDIDISLDDQFSPVLIIDGYETDLESLSGGEKTSVALAYRLALNKVINDLIQVINTKDLIILDEPTDGFSTEQLDKVRDVLEELNMKQTIIVSHEAKMESYVENVIRIEKNDGVSRVSI